jgi:hypothetical protein
MGRNRCENRPDPKFIEPMSCEFDAFTGRKTPGGLRERRFLRAVFLQDDGLSNDRSPARTPRKAHSWSVARRPLCDVVTIEQNSGSGASVARDVTTLVWLRFAEDANRHCFGCTKLAKVTLQNRCSSTGSSARERAFAVRMWQGA